MGRMNAALLRFVTMDAAFFSGLSRMAPDTDNGGMAGLLREMMPQIAAATCLVMIGTSLNMWSTQQLIKQNITTIMQSDNEQSRKIEKMEERITNLAVQHEAHRSRMIELFRRVP